jgi:hypothetical protein
MLLFSNPISLGCDITYILLLPLTNFKILSCIYWDILMSRSPCNDDKAVGEVDDWYRVPTVQCVFQIMLGAWYSAYS